MLKINRHSKNLFPELGIDIETHGFEEDLFENKNKLKELYINFIGEEVWENLYLQHPRQLQEWEIQSVKVKLEMDKMMQEQLKKFVQETHLTLKGNIKNLSH